MRRLLCVSIVVLAVPTGGAAAPAGPRTIATTSWPITRFAQDRGWLAWTTEKRCTESLSLRSLKTGRQIVKPIRSEATCSKSNSESLAVAGGRAIWTTLYGAGNTEFDFAVGTISAADPHPRRVRAMAMIRPELGPDPYPPLVAGRGKLLVYFRHEDGILSQRTQALERVAAGRPLRLFAIRNPVALAVDGGRIATAQPAPAPDVHTRIAVWTPDGRLVCDSVVAGGALNVALAGRYVVALTMQPASGAERIVVLDAGTGATLRSVPTTPWTATYGLSASDGRAVYAVDKTIYTLTLATGATRLVATASGRIAGLSISGPRVTWAENAGGHGRVRTLMLH
jgi:hypothetical protein